MVEFGLKLAENMVERWRRYYIDYKALKKLLKRLRDTERLPQIAQALSWVGFRAQRALDSPTAAALDPALQGADALKTAPPKPGLATEMTPLLSTLGAIQSGLTGAAGMRTSASTDSLSREFESPSEHFENALLEQVDKVDGFYIKELRILADDFKKLCEIFECQYRFRELEYFGGMDVEAVASTDSPLAHIEQVLERAGHRKMSMSPEGPPAEAPPPAESRAFSPSLEAEASLLSSLRSPKNPEVTLSRSVTLGANAPLPTRRRSMARRMSWSVLPFGSEDEGAGSESDPDEADDGPEGPDATRERRRMRKRARKQARMLAACSDEVQSSIQQIISDSTREMWLLQNFCILNYTACVKILKKHDKLFPETKLHGRLSRAIEQRPFFGHSGMDALITDMEALVADLFCEGNTAHARGMLLTKRGLNKPDWAMMHLGYRLGVGAVLFVWVAYDCAVQAVTSMGDNTMFTLPAFPIFRAVGGLLMLHWAWGVSVLVWSRTRINYIYLFDFDPRRVAKPREIFAAATDETIVYFVSLLLYYKVKMARFPAWIPAGYYPFCLALYAIYRLVHPWHLKRVLWKAVQDCVFSPFAPVTFYDTYVADVLTSMVKIFQDIAWSACYFFSFQFLEDSEARWQSSETYSRIVIPIICMVPLWIRFQQCLRRFYDTKDRWPHLANAFKYALSQAVSLFGALYPLYYFTIQRHQGEAADAYLMFWIGVFIISALYSFSWDVFVDWNLGRPQHGFLGEPAKLMFSRRWCYYLAIFADLFLRFSWVVTLIPPQGNHITILFPAYVGPVMMALEIMRRTAWSMFRLENEHQRNTSGFRRVHFVPLLFDTEKKQESEAASAYTGWRVLAEVLVVFAAVIAVLVATALNKVTITPAPVSDVAATDDDDDFTGDDTVSSFQWHESYASWGG